MRAGDEITDDLLMAVLLDAMRKANVVAADMIAVDRTSGQGPAIRIVAHLTAAWIIHHATTPNGPSFAMISRVVEALNIDADRKGPPDEATTEAPHAD